MSFQPLGIEGARKLGNPLQETRPGDVQVRTDPWYLSSEKSSLRTVSVRGMDLVIIARVEKHFSALRVW